MELKLPQTVVDRHDIAQLAREVQAIDEFMLQSQLRQPGEPMTQLPRLSRMLEELVTVNGLNLLNQDDRRHLKEAFEWLKEHAPTVHISFAVEPSALVVGRLVDWFRTQIHPFTLVKFGLQPTLAAGCTMRTYSKYYDLSLRKTLKSKNYMLVNLVKGLPPEGNAPVVQSAGTIPVMATVPISQPLPIPAPPMATPPPAAVQTVIPVVSAIPAMQAAPAGPVAAAASEAAPAPLTAEPQSVNVNAGGPAA